MTEGASAKKDLKQTLASTLPDSCFSVEGIEQSAHIETTGDTHDPAETLTETSGEFLIQSPHISAKDPKLLADENGQDARYALEGILGSGGMGKVYAYRDNNLNRDVAVKCLKEQMQVDDKKVSAFVNEARITASLEHSGVLPIMDLDITETGELYYTMRRVQGISLGEAIERIEEDPQSVPEIVTLNDRINLIIKVCETLEFAHRRGIIHRDIKPENIMLGELGEVFIVDWGTALIMDNDGAKKAKRVGTPIFMSPEQARREAPSVQDEVYAIGASLFQLLTLRFPMYTENLDVFWENKRNGILDPLTAEEQAHIPGQLQAIVLKALAPFAQDRYQSAQDLIKDLRNFQAGLAVTAFQDTMFDFWRRWLKRNKKLVMVALVMLVPLLIVLGVGASMIQSLNEERSRHWDLVFEDHFERKELGDNWSMDTGQGLIIDNQLVVSGPASVYARLMVPHGPIVKLEFEAKIATGGRVSDISTYMFTTPGEIDSYWEPDGYLYGFGTGNNTSSVMRRSGHIMSMREDVLIEPGKWHHVICERDETRVRMLVDGVEVFAIDDHYPPRFADKMFAQLYTWKSVMHVQYVKMYTKTVAERARTIDIADEFFWSGEYKSAARLYENVWQSHAGTAMGHAAQFGLALCYVEQERYDEGIGLLEQLIEDDDARDMHLTAQLKIAEIYFIKEEVQKGIDFADPVIKGTKDLANKPEVMMFFDYAFNIVKKVPQNTKEQLDRLNLFCEWWLSVYPQHYTITKGRFFYIWGLIHRRCGDWEGFERLMLAGLNSEYYKGPTDGLTRMLFQAQWRGKWNEERLIASKNSSVADLYLKHMFYLNKIDEFLELYPQLLQSTERFVPENARRIYKNILESKGDYDQLAREWGDDVETRRAKESLGRCLLVAKRPKDVLALFNLDWKQIERFDEDRPHPIGQIKWRLALMAYRMLGDNDSAERILKVAEVVSAQKLKISGHTWYVFALNTKKDRLAAEMRWRDWPVVSLDSSHVFAGERAMMDGDADKARRLFKKALELPYSVWDEVARLRMAELD